MGMLTVGERQKLAELRRKMQKAPSPAEEFVSRMKKEVRDTHTKRIERGIAYLLVTLTLGFVVYTLRKVRFEDISGFMAGFWR
ncbi:MAG: hypothetical protein UV94_C0040G0002 [Parcubacteria group bacterium GW2011_GWC1_43_30]|nr:MAG: hypothetical protein UV94_C0040G0002 [Parcubacteria group bacterium GW2011_GWC1_43_30]